MKDFAFSTFVFESSLKSLFELYIRIDQSLRNIIVLKSGVTDPLSLP